MYVSLFAVSAHGIETPVGTYAKRGRASEWRAARFGAENNNGEVAVCGNAPSCERIIARHRAPSSFRLSISYGIGGSARN